MYPQKDMCFLKRLDQNLPPTKIYQMGPAQSQLAHLTDKNSHRFWRVYSGDVSDLHSTLQRDYSPHLAVQESRIQDTANEGQS